MALTDAQIATLVLDAYLEEVFPESNFDELAGRCRPENGDLEGARENVRYTLDGKVLSIQKANENAETDMSKVNRDALKSTIAQLIKISDEFLAEQKGLRPLKEYELEISDLYKQSLNVSEAALKRFMDPLLGNANDQECFTIIQHLIGTLGGTFGPQLTWKLRRYLIEKCGSFMSQKYQEHDKGSSV